MKNFEMLKQIAERRQTGYTTAVAQTGKLIAVSSIRYKRYIEKLGGRSIACSEELPDPSFDQTIIPDNALLFDAVYEADDRIKELEKSLKTIVDASTELTSLIINGEGK